MFRRTLFILLLTVLGCTSAFAQMGSVQGIVNLADGTPAAGARVMLESEQGGEHGHHSMHGMTLTDAAGAFSFTDVRAGGYDIIAMRMMAGFAQAEIEVVAGQTTNITLTLSGDGGGHHDGDSLTVVDLEGTAIVVETDSMMHQMTHYFLDIDNNGTADYRLSFGPPWYDPGNGAQRPNHGDPITIRGGMFTYGEPPMVIVYEINGQFWRAPGSGHGGDGGGMHGMAGCDADSVTGVELAGTAVVMEPGEMEHMPGMEGMHEMHGDMTMYGLGDGGMMMPEYMLDFGRPEYDPGNGAQRPQEGDQITIVGGQVYCPEMMMPCVIVYEINGMFWREPGDTTGLGPLGPADVDEPRLVGAPQSYLTAMNYPNPFNPATTIQYSLPAAGDVRLSVFDLEGREVAVLVNQSQAAGTYAVSWNGSGSASGVYFYRLSAGGQSVTNRILLLK